MPGLNQPSLDKLRGYGVTIPKVKDITWNPLYDYQTYPAAGQSTFTFFQVPVGQSSKELTDTNMKLAGQLSAGEAFLITGIQVEFYPAVADIVAANLAANAAVDHYKVMTSAAYLQLNILNKDFTTQGPLNKFPPVNYFRLDSSLVSDAAAAPLITNASLMQTKGDPFEVSPLALMPNMSFSVSIVFKAAVAINADARFGVSLRGYRIRSAQ